MQPPGLAVRVFTFIAVVVGVSVPVTLAQQAAGGQAQASGAAPAAPTGAVSGVVLDATTHQPIEGVNIQLGPPPQAPATRLANTFTDERGRFVFTSVGPGTYFINAIKAGYADGHYGPGVNGALGGNIVLATNGQWFSAANIDMLKLAAIGGRVVDEHGDPVIGAYVRALTQVVLVGVTHLTAGSVTTTDDLGEYRLAGLRPGKYVISVPSVSHSIPAAMSVADIEGMPADRLAAQEASAARTGNAPVRRNNGEILDGDTARIIGNYTTPPLDPSGRLQAYPVTFYPGTTLLSGANTIDVAAGDDKPGFDITLQAVPAVRVSGRLDGGGAYDGASVRLVATGLDELGEGSETATAAVRADGTFTMLGVPAGSYMLLAPGASFEVALRSSAIGLRDRALPSTPGLPGNGARGGLVSGAASMAYNAHLPETTDAHLGFARQPVVVGMSDVTNLIVPLQRAAVMHGHVVFEDLTPPPMSLNAVLVPADGNATLGAHDVQATGVAYDTVEIPLIAPGEYALRVSNLTIKSIMMSGEDYSRRPLAFTSGQDADVTVTITGKPAKLNGVVRDANGAAVPRGCAIAFPTDKTLWRNYGFTPTWVRPSVGQSDGSYQITNIRAGEYFVVGVDGEHVSGFVDPAFLESALPFATRVTLDWGEAKTLNLLLMVKK